MSRRRTAAQAFGFLPATAAALIFVCSPVQAAITEIAEAESISKSYVSRILRLALLAPDVVEAILAERTDQGMMLEQLERPLPASWEEQRQRLLAYQAAP